MAPIMRADGAIINTAELRVEDVVQQKVLCPCCGDRVFQMWPLGWDSHAAHKCAGLLPSSEKERKQEFKSKYKFLFKR